MGKRGLEEWINKPKISRTLLAFAVPKTPAQAEKELGVKKVTIRPFIEKLLLEPLTPEARKGRFYILTRKARRLLKLPGNNRETGKDWNSIGWVLASSMQRTIILKTMDSMKMTSEEIRERAAGLNPRISRTSIKDILKELIDKGVVESRIHDRKRYYWISDDGMLLKAQLGI